MLIKARVYDSLRQVKRIKFTLLVSLCLAASVWFVGRAAARDLDFDLHVYPNPFTAGVADETTGKYAQVCFTTGYDGIFSLYIYDFEGKLVKTLCEGRSIGPGDCTIQWKGTGGDDKVVAPGPYVVVLEMKIQGETYRDTFVAVALR
jgi:hypothetical protein